MKLSAAKGVLSTFVSFERKDIGGMVQGVTDLLHVASGRAQKANEYTKATRTSAADVVRWPHFRALYHTILTVFTPRFLGVVARTPRQVQTLKSGAVTQVP